MKSTTLLLEDHKQILRAANVLEIMTGRASGGEARNLKDVNDVLGFLKGFGDRHHQGTEEFVVFPSLLQDHHQKNFHEFCGLIFEHNRQRSLIDGLEASVLTKSTKDFIEFGSRLVQLLRTHIDQEGKVLIALMESTLSPSDDENVARDMAAYDRPWQDKELPALLRCLDSLESKYVKKARAHALMTA